MRLDDVLLAGTELLEENRIPSPRLTAEVLLAHCLNRDRPYLYAHGDDSLNSETHRRYEEMLLRRVSREPLQYITGTQEFYGRPFSVNSAVLIPRPETEFLIDAVCHRNSWGYPRIVDVGTGSGCIGITLALELPGAIVSATDIALDALEVAKDNATRLSAGVSFACMDLLSGLTGLFEFIVSNPPYIAREERAGLQREVREFEPEVALSVESAPTKFYRRLIDQAATHLIEGGFLVLEMGYSMEAAVRGQFDRGWSLAPTVTDLSGIPRALVAKKTA